MSRSDKRSNEVASEVRLEGTSVAVIGASGFLGSAIADAFDVAGATTERFARNPIAVNVDLGVHEVHRLDVASDRRAIAAIIERVHHVVLAVGGSLPAESNLDPLADANIQLAPILNVLEAARARPEVRVTLLSSGGTVYGNPARNPVDEHAPCEPISAYGVAKLAGEKYAGMYARIYGVDIQILRIANAYGPGQPRRASQGLVAALMRAAIDREPITIFGDGHHVRDYVHAEDIARAVVALAGEAEHPELLNVGTGIPVSITDLVRIVADVTATPLEVVRMPLRPFDVDGAILDVSALGSVIPWAPMSIETGVAHTWQRFGESHRAGRG